MESKRAIRPQEHRGQVSGIQCLVVEVGRNNIERRTLIEYPWHAAEGLGISVNNDSETTWKQEMNAIFTACQQ